MSAKSSVIHGNDFHLFKDYFDDEHVYLRLPQKCDIPHTFEKSVTMHLQY